MLIYPMYKVMTGELSVKTESKTKWLIEIKKWHTTSKFNIREAIIMQESKNSIVIDLDL